tara:strand:- start:4577 stop:6412 length:1836 start_codon:yes stop_codon:yes gene_type:complete
MIFPNHQYSEIENTEALDNSDQNKNDSDNFLRRLANAAKKNPEITSRLIEILGAVGSNIYASKDAKKAIRRNDKRQANANLINALSQQRVAFAAKEDPVPSATTSMLQGLSAAGGSYNEHLREVVAQENLDRTFKEQQKANDAKEKQNEQNEIELQEEMFKEMVAKESGLLTGSGYQNKTFRELTEGKNGLKLPREEQINNVQGFLYEVFSNKAPKRSVEELTREAQIKARAIFKGKDQYIINKVKELKGMGIAELEALMDQENHPIIKDAIAKELDNKYEENRSNNLDGFIDRLNKDPQYVRMVDNPNLYTTEQAVKVFLNTVDQQLILKPELVGDTENSSSITKKEFDAWRLSEVKKIGSMKRAESKNSDNMKETFLDGLNRLENMYSQKGSDGKDMKYLYSGWTSAVAGWVNNVAPEFFRDSVSGLLDVSPMQAADLSNKLVNKNVIINFSASTMAIIFNGGRPTDRDFAIAKSMVPTVADPYDIAKAKIDIIKKLLNSASPAVISGEEQSEEWDAISNEIPDPDGNRFKKGGEGLKDDEQKLISREVKAWSENKVSSKDNGGKGDNGGKDEQRVDELNKRLVTSDTSTATLDTTDTSTAKLDTTKQR